MLRLEIQVDGHVQEQVDIDPGREHVGTAKFHGDDKNKAEEACCSSSWSVSDNNKVAGRQLQLQNVIARANAPSVVTLFVGMTGNVSTTLNTIP